MKANEVIAHFIDKYKEKTRLDFRVTPIDARAAKNLSKESDVLELIDGFFELNDPWLNANGYFLKYLPNQVNKIRLKKRVKPKEFNILDLMT